MGLRIEFNEIKRRNECLRYVAGYKPTLQDRSRNVDIWQELNIKSILYKIAQYQPNVFGTSEPNG